MSRQDKQAQRRVTVTGWAERSQAEGRSGPRREAGFVSAACQKPGVYWRRGWEAPAAVLVQMRKVGGSRSERPRVVVAGLTPDELRAASCRPQATTMQGVRIKLERFSSGGVWAGRAG